MAIKLFPHRFWAFLAIPVVLIATFGVKWIMDKVKDKNVQILLYVIIIVAVLFSSASPKHAVETSNWPPGVRFTSYEEVAIYSAILNDLPKNSRVFMYTPGRDSHIIGVDQYSLTWKTNVIDFKNNLINKSIEDTYDFLVENDYEYMIIGGITFKEMAQEFGENETQEHITNFLNDLQNTTYFSPVAQNKGAALLKVN